jgi:hypothetical protein
MATRNNEQVYTRASSTATDCAADARCTLPFPAHVRWQKPCAEYDAAGVEVGPSGNYFKNRKNNNIFRLIANGHNVTMSYYVAFENNRIKSPNELLDLRIFHTNRTVQPAFEDMLHQLQVGILSRQN